MEALEGMGFKKSNAVYIYSEKPDLILQTSSYSATLTYDNNRFTATPGPTITTTEGSYPIAFEYVQNKPAEGAERGKWLIDFAHGVTMPFGRKDIGRLIYIINGSNSGEIALERDPVITNAIAYRSVGIDAGMASFDTITDNINVEFRFAYKDFSSLGLKIIKWDKLKPTPKMFQNFNLPLTSGGTTAVGSMTLTMIPFDYDYDFLDTATNTPNEIKYYIIDGFAYVVSSIEKRSFYWDVRLERYVGVNKDTYQSPEGL